MFFYTTLTHTTHVFQCKIEFSCEHHWDIKFLLLDLFFVFCWLSFKQVHVVGMSLKNLTHNYNCTKGKRMNKLSRFYFIFEVQKLFFSHLTNIEMWQHWMQVLKKHVDWVKRPHFDLCSGQDFSYFSWSKRTNLKKKVFHALVPLWIIKMNLCLKELIDFGMKKSTFWTQSNYNFFFDSE